MLSTNWMYQCLFWYALLENITACNGVTISDKLYFFVGDQPANQYERRTQQGGKHKCDGCGVQEVSEREEGTHTCHKVGVSVDTNIQRFPQVDAHKTTLKINAYPTAKMYVIKKSTSYAC